MYWTTPSGTRYHTGKPRRVRSRQSVDEIASAGTSSKLTSCSGNPETDSTCPGRLTATKCASDQSSSTSFHYRIWAMASAPEMKNRSASGRSARMSRSVSIVYVGFLRSMSTRLTVNRGLDAVAITVMR